MRGIPPFVELYVACIASFAPIQVALSHCLVYLMLDSFGDGSKIVHD